MRVLLVSTYEQGHQPLQLATPAAALAATGHDVRTLDLAVEPWDAEAVAWADGVAFSVPMHTAMRLATRAAQRVARARPDLPACFFGLYAGMGEQVGDVFAGEYQPALVAWAATLPERLLAGTGRAAHPAHSAHAARQAQQETVVELGRQPSVLPDRSSLPPLDRYARLVIGGEERLVGYVEATRGCSHRCRHCPVPVIYDGRVRVVDEDVVLADVGALVSAGAQHITFGDPDFLNAVPHAKRVVAALRTDFADVTFDCTVKVEHILRHADVWQDWAAAGCLFVTSAIEGVNDDILERLDKGHTAAEAAAAVAVVRAAGIDLRPSFLPFTPWATVDDVIAILHFVAANDLIGSVDPVQYSIRLLLPKGSLLLDDPVVQGVIGPYDPERLTYTWEAVDPRLDVLHGELAALVEASAAAGESIQATFMDVNALVHAAAGITVPDGLIAAGSTEGRPRLTEPWFC
jgi:hypothetical protein